MTRHIVVKSDDLVLVSSTYEETTDPAQGTGHQRILGKNISVSVDGKKILEHPIPLKLLDSEPKDLGSQVKGITRLHSKLVIFTKIGHDSWVFQHDQNYKQTTTAVRWRDISVWEVVSPKPEPLPQEEPKGAGAVVETDCHGSCESDAMFVRSNGLWYCQNCCYSYVWEKLVQGSPEVKILREGL